MIRSRRKQHKMSLKMPRSIPLESLTSSAFVLLARQALQKLLGHINNNIISNDDQETLHVKKEHFVFDFFLCPLFKK